MNSTKASSTTPTSQTLSSSASNILSRRRSSIPYLPKRNDTGTPTNTKWRAGAVTDIAEQPAILEIHKTYGKTIHTWPVDISPDLPLGPPNLMVSYTGEGQGPPPEMIKARDEKCGMDTQAKRKLRASYLPEYEVRAEADQWEKTGKGIVFEAKEVPFKPYDGPGSTQV
ncbi:predicted protein [Postia placenta Mad-698-R]|nr:predicted protein [Postia placenta Mad-698-R]